MADLASLQADLEQLKAVRRSGALSVTIAGKEVRYRSDAELTAAIAAIESEINGEPAPRNILVRSTKGF